MGQPPYVEIRLDWFLMLATKESGLDPNVVLFANFLEDSQNNPPFPLAKPSRSLSDTP